MDGGQGNSDPPMGLIHCGLPGGRAGQGEGAGVHSRQGGASAPVGSLVVAVSSVVALVLDVVVAVRWDAVVVVRRDAVVVVGDRHTSDCRSHNSRLGDR